jgi:heptosyltransferase-2
MHRVDYYLNLIAKAGLRVEDRFCEFYFQEEDASFAGRFLARQGVKEGDFLVGINAGGNWEPKRWPKERWAALADFLIRELKAKVMITGGPEDKQLAEEIRALMSEKPLIASGALNLKQFAALCPRLDLFISADTGPLHIAGAAGAKQVIALFGPTSPDITGPVPLRNTVILRKDSGCKIPCYAADCRDNRCMKAITPEDVIEKVRLISAPDNKGGL